MNEKSFLIEKKTTFTVLQGCHLEKNKYLLKNSGTSFKVMKEL